ncbi:MAG: hypothetical protein EOO92_25130 [Pedobacter sp.]|nr:MAG: hypothetical protein EOO92_25130 [Pedobacter sp.]
MKNFIRTGCMVLAAAAMFTSCKDDDKSRTELLTSGNWKIVSDQSRVGNGAWQEDIGTYDPCELDNYAKFSEANTVAFNEGPTKCDPLDDQEYVLPWSFVNGEDQISVAGEVYTIDELNGSTLTLSTSEVIGSTTYYYRQTLKH